MPLISPPNYSFISIKYKAMKQFNPLLLSQRLRRSLLLSAFFLGACFVTNAQVYTASLSGANELPPNGSPGTGHSVVTVDAAAMTMRVNVTFSGLLAPTTASHIHAPTAVAGIGTAGVATAVPTFTGFPLGVTSGTYDHTFDMTLASSYNPAYLAANGGIPASAFAALKAALNNGTAYLNVHTAAVPAGEIRGFLTGCPIITVSIPDAFALPKGVLPNTVYPAYAPAASLTLTTNVSGGSEPYTYDWSDGSMTSAIAVSPMNTTQYSVTVQDQNGCTGSASKTVNVMNISGGHNGDKIMVCHKGNSLTVDASAVRAHLGHGDMLGSCSEKVALRNNNMDNHAVGLSVKALPNPSFSYFDVMISSRSGDNIKVNVYDLLGRVVETKSSVPSGQSLRLGAMYAPGIYTVEILQGTQRQLLKLVKEK